MIQRICKERIRLLNTAFTAMDLCAKGQSNLMGGRFARTGERQNDWFQSQGSAPFVSKIIEK
jgi:hypothetical protein